MPRYSKHTLNAALAVLDKRIAACQRTEAEWAKKYPDDKLGQATERAARHELELVRRLIVEACPT